jgi:hypothetical protein
MIQNFRQRSKDHSSRPHDDRHIQSVSAALSEGFVRALSPCGPERRKVAMAYEQGLVLEK